MSSDKKTDTDAEQARRQIVRDTRARGSSALRHRKQQDTRNRDYQTQLDAAAEETNAIIFGEERGPVLFDETTQARTAGSQHIADLDAAFAASGNRLDEVDRQHTQGVSTLRTAYSNELERFLEELERQREITTSRRGSTAGYDAGLGTPPGVSGRGPVSTAAVPPRTDFFDDLTPSQVQDLEYANQTLGEDSTALGQEIDRAFTTFYEDGTDFAQAEMLVWNGLRAAGYDDRTIAGIMPGFIARWQATFLGVPVTYNPAVGAGPGISGPFVPEHLMDPPAPAPAPSRAGSRPFVPTPAGGRRGGLTL